MDHIQKRLAALLLLAGCLMQVGCASGNPDLKAGRDQARKDLAVGKLVYQQPIPETFLRSWEMESFLRPEKSDANLVDYYAAVLADRYTIEHQIFMYHVGTPAEERCRVEGYNQEMTATIEKRFGVGILDTVWKEACETPSAKREEYLKPRREAAERRYGVSTRPAPASRNAN